MQTKSNMFPNGQTQIKKKTCFLRSQSIVVLPPSPLLGSLVSWTIFLFCCPKLKRITKQKFSRFPGQLNADLRKLAVNMVPFPRWRRWKLTKTFPSKTFTELVLFSGSISSCLDLPPWLPGSQPAMILSRYCSEQIIFSEINVLLCLQWYSQDTVQNFRPNYILGDATIKCTSLWQRQRPVSSLLSPGVDPADVRCQEHDDCRRSSSWKVMVLVMFYSLLLS